MKLYVEKLNLEFSGKEILNDISFSIQEGEFVSILGQVDVVNPPF